MAFKASVQVKGLKETEARFKKLGKSLFDFNRELKSSGKFMRNFFGNKVFSSKGAVIRERWAPLKPSTIAMKGHAQILVDTGRMRNSFRFRSSRSLLVFNNTTPYLQFHQFGTSKMPRRTVMKVTDALAKDVGLIFQKGVNRRIKKAFK